VNAEDRIRLPSVSVVVCTLRRTMELERCLAALAGVAGVSEVVVVDNDPAGSAEDAARRPGVRYVHEPAPGLSRARNAGARAARSDVVAYLDDDAVPDAHWVAELSGAFLGAGVVAASGRVLPFGRAAGPTHGAVAPKDGRADRAGGFVVDRETPNWFERTALGGMCLGSNMAVRREVLLGATPFDERLGLGAAIAGAEEHYLFYRIVAGGRRVAHVPSAVVRHPDPQGVRDTLAHLRRTADAFGAYLVLLWMEARDHRRAVRGFVWDALSGAERPWRDPTPRPSSAEWPVGLSKWRKALALLLGPIRYIRAGRLRR
jgi:glycosyltransferase involved in cell wall biosynthesis